MSRLIDADALLDDVFERYCKDCDKRKGIKNGKYRIIYDVGEAPCRACDVDDMKDELENAPTVDAVPAVHAKILNPNPYGLCSRCNNLIDIRDEFNYCPKCGAMLKTGEVTE